MYKRNRGPLKNSIGREPQITGKGKVTLSFRRTFKVTWPDGMSQLIHKSNRQQINQSKTFTNNGIELATTFQPLTFSLQTAVTVLELFVWLL